jgi:hypothetical protein
MGPCSRHQPAKPAGHAFDRPELVDRGLAAEATREVVIDPGAFGIVHLSVDVRVISSTSSMQRR